MVNLPFQCTDFMHTHELAIDIETFSSVDLKSAGGYKYAASPDFELLICSYKIDDGPTVKLDLDNAREVLFFIELLVNPDYLKTAFNAPFERICLSYWCRQKNRLFEGFLAPDQWTCTMAKAYSCGMQGGLDIIAGILKVGHKMPEGKNLIRYFCVPCAPTKVNKQRTRNYSFDDPEKFSRFEAYCIEDVELEYRIRKILKAFPTSAQERALWILDQKINDRGVRLDPVFIRNAITIDQTNSETLLARVMELTGVRNSRSVPQLKKWLEAEIGEEIDGLGKDKLPVILKKFPSDTVTEFIKLRQMTSKTSIKKYEGMLRCIGSDHKVRGLLQFCGASRTGRWAGRLIQPHNLRKSEVKDQDLDLARRLVTAGDGPGLALCYADTKCNIVYPWEIVTVPDIISQLIRTAFIPSPGNRFIVSDFSAIEARVIAWLAGETWRLDVFKGHGKIYEASAAAMFHVAIELVTKGSDYRKRGKIAELALGFGGGVGALARMEISNKVPEKDRIPDGEKEVVKNAWRHASPRICALWYGMEEACITAVNNPGQIVPVDTVVADWHKFAPGIHIKAPISFHVKSHVLYMTLPSGRQLCYLRPRIIENKFGGDSVSYEGMEADSKKWGRVETYGGKLTENAVQAVARDLLAGGMLRVNQAGYDIALHVHDEIVTDTPFEDGSLEEVNSLMAVVPDWATGLPLGAEGFETEYYKKES